LKGENERCCGRGRGEPRSAREKKSRGGEKEKKGSSVQPRGKKKKCRRPALMVGVRALREKESAFAGEEKKKKTIAVRGRVVRLAGGGKGDVVF